MQRNSILIIAGAVLFILSIVYIVWNQSSIISDIFKQHQEQLQSEIKAIQSERLVLKRMIDSLDIKINIEKKDLLNDIDSFLRKNGKK